jgi:TusA-related sulfurtransferase
MAKEVDARGLSCPQPLFLATRALAEESGPVTVAVDSAAAAESLRRAARREAGRPLEIVEDGPTTFFKFGPRS